MQASKPNLYIHGGIHKTATTSLQYFFSQNYDVFLRDSFLYPSTGRDELIQHHFFFASIRKHKDQYFTPKKSYVEYLVELNNEIKLVKPKNVVLSSEIFCVLNDGNVPDLKNKLEMLFNLFKNVKVILYVRRPDLYAISENNMAIWYLRRKQHELIFPNIIEWIDILGKEKLIFRPFEIQQFIGGNIYTDFLSILGIKNKDQYQYPNNKFNESISDNNLELCRIINNSHPDINKTNFIKRELLKALSNTEDSQKGFL